MKRNRRYLLWLLLLPVWVLWSCQSHDIPAPVPGVDDDDEVEAEVDLSTRAAGPSDGYVHDLTAMAFWRNDTDPDSLASYRFAYYSNVYAGEVTDNPTGRRKVRFMIRKQAGKRQRFVFLANLYACNIYPHMFADTLISAGIRVQDALNEYTYFPKYQPEDSIPGWSVLAGSQSEPFPMCGETKYSYSFDNIEDGKVFVLNNGTENETVYLYRMAAKVDIYFTAEVIRDTGGLKQMKLNHGSGKGYVAYNLSGGYLNSDITVSNLEDYGSSSDDWKTLKAWVPDDQTGTSYEQTYGIVPVPNAPDPPDDDDYTMKVDGPVYMNEAARYDADNPDNALVFAFTANDHKEYILRLENYDILRNCHYHIRINKVAGSLSATLSVTDWTEVKIDNPSPLPL